LNEPVTFQVISKPIIMRKQIIPFVSIMIAFAVTFSCEKNQQESPDIDENLLFTEKAFPNSTGDTVTLQYNGQAVTCELIEGYYIYQGDMIIQPDADKASKGAGIDVTSKRWPFGVVYYVISSNIPAQNRITDAIKQWESSTDLLFEERIDENNYIQFTWHPDGCASWVGMQGGKQDIWIADWGNTGSVMHEIGHALGLEHEHSKKNRDEHIRIIWENVDPNNKHNFEINYGTVITEGFDFSSLMLYPSNAFPIDNTKPTITKLDGSTFSAQRNALSSGDIQIISKMYSDLHDPVYVTGFADMQGNAHIASDGTYFYTIGYGRGRINKFNSEFTRVQSYNMPLIEGRGLSYNQSDGKLYASINGGHIIRITDLDNGIIDTIYRGIMQYPGASFALSEDGNWMYDFYNGTLKIYDFVSGSHIRTLDNLSFGGDEEYYGGIGAIAVDYNYLYTWDPWSGTIYVYNHDGIFQRTLNIDRGSVGMSLSVIDGYLFLADDPFYDPGFWLVYNIRNPVKEE